MALYDWNQNGKKDVADDFIEYQIYKQSTSGDKSNCRYTPGNGGGISTFGALLAVIGGLFLACGILGILSDDVENVPVFLIIILWIIISGCLCAGFDNIGI